MNRVYGILSEYALVKQDYTRWIVCYDLTPLEDGVHYEWNEVYFNKRQQETLDVDMLKDIIIKEVNAHTDEMILSGFIWSDKQVWLSTENQFNFKAAYDLALQTKGGSLPVKFKLGEDAEGSPVYHTFETLKEFSDFYTSAIAYIQGCLEDGWRTKDSLDWSAYKDALEVFFPSVEPQSESEA